MPDNIRTQIDVDVNDQGVQQLAQRLGDLQAQMGGALPQNINESMHNVESIIQQSSGHIGGIFSSLFQQISGGAKQHLGEHVAEAGKKAGEGIEKFSGAIGSASGGVGNFTSGIGDLLGKLGPTGVAIGAAVAAMGELAHAGQEALEREEKLSAAFIAEGQSVEQAEKSTSALEKVTRTNADALGKSKDQLEEATAKYRIMGGTMDNIGDKQKIIAGLSLKFNGDMTKAAEMYALAEQGEFTKLARKIPALKGITDKQQALNIINEQGIKLSGAQEKLAEGSLGSMARMKNALQGLEEGAGKVVFNALQPLFDILTGVANVVESVVVPPIEVLGALWTAVSGAFSETIGEIKQDFMGLIQEIFPSFGQSGEEAGGVLEKITGAIKEYLTPVLHTLFEILSVGIKTFIGVTGAVVDVVKWLGNVTGISTLLSEGWNALVGVIKDVVKWFKDSADTINGVVKSISTLGGLLPEHKKKTEESAEATEKLKSSTEDANNALTSYINNLKKQQQEMKNANATAKENSEVVIQQIQGMLASGKLSPEEKKVWEERLAQWTTYGKAAVKAGAEETAAAEKAKKQIGDIKKEKAKKEKEVHDTSLADEIKSINTAAKEELDIRAQQYEKDKARIEDDIANKKISKTQGDAQLKQLDVQYHADLSGIDAKYFTEASARLQDAHDKQAAAIQVQLAKHHITKEKANQELKKLEQQFQAEQITLQKEFDTKSLQEHALSLKAQTALSEEQSKELQKIKKEQIDFAVKEGNRALKSMEEELGKEKIGTVQWIQDSKMLYSQKYELAKTTEDAQYKLEQDRIKQEITDEKEANVLREQLEKNHNAALKGIDQTRIDDFQKMQQTLQKSQQDTLKQWTGPLVQGYHTGWQALDKGVFQPWIARNTEQKTVFGQIEAQFLNGVISMAETWIEQEAAKLAASIIYGSSSVAATTAANATIMATAGPAAIAESIATLGAADAAGSAAYAAAQAGGLAMNLIPHADGGIMTQPTLMGIIGNSIHYGGEDGHEAIMPLQNSKYPGLHDMATGQGSMETNNLLKQLIQTSKEPKLGVAIDGYRNKLSQSAATQQYNQRKL